MAASFTTRNFTASARWSPPTGGRERSCATGNVKVKLETVDLGDPPRTRTHRLLNLDSTASTLFLRAIDDEVRSYRDTEVSKHTTSRSHMSHFQTSNQRIIIAGDR